MIILDTTVFVYAVGGEHRFHDPCRRLVAAVADGNATATTTVEVIQEFAHVRARRRGRADAARLAASFAELLTPLLEVTADDLSRGLALFARSDKLGVFDAVLVATAARRKGAALVSADAAFSHHDDIRHVVPDERGIASLLDASR